MSHLIPSDAISRYSAAPSPSKVQSAVSLHNNIRDTLGSGYDTFLQGSYKNDTGVVDINDVDIVALRKDTTSRTFNSTTFSFSTISWEQIFQEIQDKLESSNSYRNKTEIGDKCIIVNTNFKADVVPAIYIQGENDPIAIYSFRERSERKNYPRIHYQNNVSKHQNTQCYYKPMVRMFKQWVRNWFPNKKVAPSFYVECLIYNVPNDNFYSDGASTFSSVGKYIIKNFTKDSYIRSVAGDKDILTASEWDPTYFLIFQARLIQSVISVDQALKATTIAEARRLWREAFNE